MCWPPKQVQGRELLTQAIQFLQAGQAAQPGCAGQGGAAADGEQLQRPARRAARGQAAGDQRCNLHPLPRLGVPGQVHMQVQAAHVACVHGEQPQERAGALHRRRAVLAADRHAQLLQQLRCQAQPAQPLVHQSHVPQSVRDKGGCSSVGLGVVAGGGRQQRAAAAAAVAGAVGGARAPAACCPIGSPLLLGQVLQALDQQGVGQREQRGLRCSGAWGGRGAPTRRHGDGRADGGCWEGRRRGSVPPPCGPPR